MRGKFRQAPNEYPEIAPPSMRPAHYAREVRTSPRMIDRVGSPSMRPAHYAREVGDATSWDSQYRVGLQ